MTLLRFHSDRRFLAVNESRLRLQFRAALLFALALALPSAALSQSGGGSEAIETDPLSSRIAEEVDRALTEGDRDRDVSDELFDATVLAHGRVDPLIRRLVQRAESDDPKAARHAKWLASQVLRRLGDQPDALTLAEALVNDDPEDAEAWLMVAELRDMSGKRDDAIEAYEKLLPLITDVEEQSRIRLRLALLDAGKKKPAGSASTSPRSSSVAATPLVIRAAGSTVVSGAPLRSEGASRSAPPPDPTAAEALVAFASAEGRSVEVRNRSAIVLALLGNPSAAIDLFVVPTEQKQRFKGEMRRAEWAIQAKELEQAQNFAWRALEVSKTRRNRRYALAVLVESYRRDDALQELIDKFAAEPELHDDARGVWIDLLRETGQIDPALELFRTSNDGEFTVEMRRELLEMCRESGRDETLVDAFRELIEESPEQVEWREGLARHYLERGDRDAAVQVWDGFPQHAKSVGQLMLGADSVRSLGLDDIAIAYADRARTMENGLFSAGLFLFDLHRNRGRMAEAEAALEALHGDAANDAPERMSLSEAFEQIGNKERAVTVLEALRDARGDDTGEDLDMRLSWLYSEIGEEEKAMDGWMRLWNRIESIPRRRYVEDRMMATASRLGRLADIAIELEEKLSRGEADARESGLLIRLYSKVGDPVSAAEVIEEYLKYTGGDPVNALQEKARVYVQCTDYHNYEKTIRRLIQVDPEGEPDYLRQLAMSCLERGQPEEARDILTRLKELERGSDSAEFEAGVLALAGLRDDAMVAYRRGIVANPERIESYLLLANLMRELRQTRRAIGMFQHLALISEKDDLFTIAIDGLLNMRAPAPVLEWARRATLERLANRHEKMYLYQLISDLSEQINDRPTMIRSLESAISIAGERRLPLLRELMDLAAQSGGSREQRLAFGRRLIGLGELVPPDVYLDLGEAFLEAKDVTSAWKTFAMASEVPDYNAFQRRVALSFEKARFLPEALRVYERILVSQSSDVSLMLKVGELHEQLGRDMRASELYRRGIELLLSRRPYSAAREDEPEADNPYQFFFARNVGDFDQYYQQLVGSYLAATELNAAVESELARQRDRTRVDLDRLAAERAPEEGEVRTLASYPRIRDRAAFHRRVAIAYSRPELAHPLDLELLRAFPQDEELLDTLTRARLDWGMVVSARKLIEEADRPERQKQKVRFLVGVIDGDSVPGVLPMAEAIRLFLPPLIEGRPTEVATLLQRVDFSTMSPEELDEIPVLFSGCLYLGDPELALTFARHWMRVAIKHKKQYELQSILREILTRVEKTLPTEQRESLIDFLVSLTLENEERGADLIPLFPELQRQSEKPLLEADQVIEFIDQYVEQSSWGVGPLLALVPSENRVGVMRRIWPKVKPSRRANFIVDLLRSFEDKIEDRLSEFLVSSFETAFAELDNKQFFGYSIANALESNEKNIETTLAIAKVVIESEPDDLETRVAYALGLQRSGRDDEALETAKASYRAALEDKKTQPYRITNALRRLSEGFLPEHLDTFLAVLDEVEDREGASTELSERRVDLITRADDPDRLLTVLRQEVEKHPKENKLVDRLQRQLRSLGYRRESLEILERMFALDPEDKGYRNRLIGFWRGMQHPIRALEVRDAHQEATEDEADKEDDAPKSEPVPRPGIHHVKKALEEEKVDEARVSFRRLWRNFQVESNNRGMMYFGPRRFDYSWPRPRPKAAASPYRGGLSTFRESTTPPAERLSAYVELADEPFGESEMRRRLRTLDPVVLEQAGKIYEGLTLALEERLGAGPAIEQLVADIEVGRAGKIDYVLLLSLFEKDPDRIGSEGRSLLGDLAKTVHPLAGDQLRRLARLYARMGATDEAERLYRWCASLTSWESYFPRNQQFPPIPGADLIDEVVETLDGDVRERVIEAILSLGEPEEDSWSRDQYEVRVLETWIKIAGPREALERCRELCEGATRLERTVKRQTAKIAARLYAHAGEIDRALACLEIASLLEKAKSPRSNT
ncbi:MAG: tetratricopeptide repeat protein, partial [Planctomycetota bacterium]